MKLTQLDKFGVDIYIYIYKAKILILYSITKPYSSNITLRCSENIMEAGMCDLRKLRKI